MSARTAAILHPRFRAHDAKAPESVVSSNVLLAIVNARGVIDAGSVTPFAHELGHAVKAGATKILVDLTQADEVTTACMNACSPSAAARRKRRDRRRVPPRLGRQFETLGLDRRFLLAADRTEAARLLGLVGSGMPEAGAPAPRHAHAA